MGKKTIDFVKQCDALRGRKSKGKKEKKRKFGENITFDSTKSYNQISKIQFNTI